MLSVNIMVLCCVAFLWRGIESVEYKLGLLIPYDYSNQGEKFPGKYYASAISLAVDFVNADPRILPGHKLTFVWNNTQCSARKIIAQQKWQIQQGVTGFIGPSCHARKAIKLAHNKHLPVISYGSQDPVVSRMPNFARINPSDYKSSPEIIRVLKMRGWRKVTIIYQKKRYWRLFKNFLTKQLKKEQISVEKLITVPPTAVFFGQKTQDVLNYDLFNSKSQATILLTEFGVTLDILTILEKEGELRRHANHRFIATQFHRNYVESCIQYPFKWFFSMFHGIENHVATEKALKRLLLVTLKPNVNKTGQYLAFQAGLKKRARLEPFNNNVYHGCSNYVHSNHTTRCLFNKSSAMPPYNAAYLYDAVKQFAEGLHHVLQHKLELTGTNIINTFKNKHITGIDGYEYKFDEHGEIKYEYTILGVKKDPQNRTNILPLSPEEIRAV